MEQKFIIGDVVEYDNKIMVVKEPRDGSHFDLSCPKEGLVYCLVDIEEIKPAPFTLDIIIKNGWMENRYTDMFYKAIGEGRYLNLRVEGQTWIVGLAHQDLLKNIKYVHQLQHLLFGLGLNSEMEV
jgi:hypothetical protein